MKVFICLLLLTFGACISDDEKNTVLLGIEAQLIDRSKTIYTGSRLTPGDIVVEGIYSDGHKRQVDVAYNNIKYDTFSPGKKVVVVSHEQHSDSFYIDVKKARAVELDIELRERRDFYYGREIKNEDFIVWVEYSNGRRSTAPEFKVYSDNLRVGRNSINVEAEGATGYIDIDIKELSLVDVEIKGRREFYLGDTITSNDFEIIAKYIDGSREELKDFELDTQFLKNYGKQMINFKVDNRQFLYPIYISDTIDGFTYRLLDSGLAITDYSGDSKVRVPNKINGLDLISITTNAFKDKGIRELTLPEGLIYIGPSAFEGNEIKELFLPKSLELIGNDAFANNDIELLLISNKQRYSYIDSIESDFKAINLELIENKESKLRRIGQGAFKGNLIKNPLILPSTLEFIGIDAFYNNNIPYLYIPYDSRLRSIGKQAFYSNNISNKDALAMPQSLIFIGSEAFRENNLNTVSIYRNTSYTSSSFDRVEVIKRD